MSRLLLRPIEVEVHVEVEVVSVREVQLDRSATMGP